jgi:alpha-beta hydrolase superfamily lysophospholipase
MAVRFCSMRAIAIAALCIAATACAPIRYADNLPPGAPRLEASNFITADGVRLPYRAWLPETKIKAVVVAVHGMNDHSRAFVNPAHAWRRAGIATYAYDQRGFGGAPHRGMWPGARRLVDDVKAFTRLVKARHPHTPIFLLGSSMGGGVVLAALGDKDSPAVDGAILLAPAVWGREIMPAEDRVALWIAAHAAPGVQLTSDQIHIVPTDNRAVLIQMSHDPRVIKYVRVDSLYGVTNLMDLALAAAPKVRVPVLMLYGAKDQVIPLKSVVTATNRLPVKLQRFAIYRDGWHMLLRDKQAPTVYRDIVAWIADRSNPLPSGAERISAAEAIAR